MASALPVMPHCTRVWIAPFNTLMYIYYVYILDQEMPGTLMVS